MRVRYINSAGNELTLETWPRLKRYILQDWEGFGEVAADLQTRQSPYQDGVTVTQALLEPRHLSLEVVILGDSKQEVYDRRRFLQNLFNPKLGLGRLEWYQPSGKVYTISVIPDGTPGFPAGEARTRYSQLATIDLIAPDPIWEDAQIFDIVVSSVIGKLRFPLELPTEMGILDNERIIVNKGDVAAPVRIIFNGPATNPGICNKTSGEIIKVNRVLGDNEKLVVDTSFGKKKVVHVDADGNETSAFGSIDLDSNFWQLRIGENKIVYSTDMIASATMVKLRYKQRYVGV